MKKRVVFPFGHLLILFFCALILSCNFSESESEETSSVSFVINTNQLLSQNAYNRSAPDGLNSVKFLVGLRGDYSATQDAVFSTSGMKATVTFKDIPVGASVRAMGLLTLDASLGYLGYSDVTTIQKGQNTLTLKMIMPLTESVMSSPAFGVSQAANDDNMYVLFTFKTEGDSADSGSWLIFDTGSSGIYSYGVYDNLSKNTDQTVKSVSFTEYIYNDSPNGYAIVPSLKPQTITPVDNYFKFTSANGKELTFKSSGYIDIEGSELSGTIELPITTGSFNIGFDEGRTSKNLYKNFYKIALKATDKDGNEITDDITWNAKLLYGGKDINTAVVVDTVPVAYYAFDPETATLTPAVTGEGLYKILATSGPYQLYVTAEYGDNSYSSLMTIKIPEEYYYEVSADDPDLFDYVRGELEEIKSTVTLKVTGTGTDDTIGSLISVINCSAHLDFSETGITEIGNGTFSVQANSNMTYQKFLSIKLPKGLLSIGDEAFSGRSELTEIIIPNTVTTIGEKAFKACSSIKELELPETVTSIGAYAFQSCVSLSSITLPAALSAINNSAFNKCSQLESIEIPAAVVIIGESAFYECTKLSEVRFAEGSSLRSIGNSAFYSTKLQTVSLPDSLETIGNSAFYTCSNLSELLFTGTSTIQKIGESAFANTKLQSVSLPASLKIIDKYAFQNISTLIQVTLESDSQLKAIGMSAFYGTGLNGTDGKVTGILADAWKVIYYNDAYPSTSSETWMLVCKYYLGETISEDEKMTIRNNSEGNYETLNDSYDFTADNNNYYFIEI